MNKQAEDQATHEEFCAALRKARAETVKLTDAYREFIDYLQGIEVQHSIHQEILEGGA